MIFVDTSFWLALHNPFDNKHTKAVSAAGICKDRLVTSEYVLLEVGNGLARSHSKKYFAILMESIGADRKCRVIQGSAELFARSCELFHARADKDWSVIDCSSFLIMKELGIQKAFTTDHHFEQAGFDVLLKP